MKNKWAFLRIFELWDVGVGVDIVSACERVWIRNVDSELGKIL